MTQKLHVSRILGEVYTLCGDRECFFRGQGDEQWGLVSGAYRHVESIVSSTQKNYKKIFQKEFLSYHQALIKNAKNKEFKTEEFTSDWDILMELQYYGASTLLIDFTKNVAIALYFACSEPDRDGVVYIYRPIAKHESVFDSKHSFANFYVRATNKIQRLSPSYLTNRTNKQDVVFLFSQSGMIEEHAVEKIIIKKNYKNLLLQELHAVLGINAQTLFPDIYGFSLANRQTRFLKKIILDENDVEEIDVENEEIATKDTNPIGKKKYTKNIHASNEFDTDRYDMDEDVIAVRKIYAAFRKHKKISSKETAMKMNSEPDNLLTSTIETTQEEKQKGFQELRKKIRKETKMDDQFKSMAEAKELNGSQMVQDERRHQSNEHNAIANEKLKQSQSMFSVEEKNALIHQAIEEYTRSIALYNQNIYAYFNRGVSYAYLKNYKQAILDFDTVIERDTKNALAYYTRGNIKLDVLENPIEAIKDYSKAIELDASNSKTYFHRGFAWLKLYGRSTSSEEKQTHLEKASHDFTKCIELDSSFANAYFYRGHAYLKLHEMIVFPDEKNLYKSKAKYDFIKAKEFDAFIQTPVMVE